MKTRLLSWSYAFLPLVFASGEVMHAWAQQSEVISSELSPKGDIEVRYVREDPKKFWMDIWLVDAGDSTKQFRVDSAVFLGTKMFFSPDEQWMTCNIEFVSNFRSILLFKRTRGIEFHRLKSVDVYETALRFFAATEGLTRVPVFGHSAVQFVRWLPDSRYFVLKLDGWDDPHGVAVSNWTLEFNVDSLSARVDKHNRGKLVRGK